MLRKNISVLEYELPVKVTSQKEGGFVAVCPNWSDCYAQGDSVDEALWEIVGVAQSLIELYKEEGISIPLKLEIGYSFRRNTGGTHKIWWNEVKRKTCVIPHHHEIAAGTIKSILYQIGVSEKDFLKI